MKSKNMNIPFSRPPYRRLSDEQCQKLHEAALEILDRTGVRLHYQPAVALLKSGGARVSEGNRVLIPPKLVEQAFNTLPEQVTLYNRRRQRRGAHERSIQCPARHRGPEWCPGVVHSDRICGIFQFRRLRGARCEG